MITTFSSLLQALISKEVEILKAQKIKHGPTIGDMYEGLTKEVLEMSIPENLDVRVVDGFVEGVDGSLSPQIDVMIVSGEGYKIPYTSSEIWPIRNVIAVFEVKKNLHQAELKDAFGKLAKVKDIAGDWLSNGGNGGTVDITAVIQAFSMLSGIRVRNHGELESLPAELENIFHVLICEYLSPIRVVIGYNGYVNEYSLRSGFRDFIESRLSEPKGMGVGSFPNLIACGDNSIVKVNGLPYAERISDGWWPAFASNNENPLRILIELIWTRLSFQFEIQMPDEDCLSEERLIRCLDAKYATVSDVSGWQYSFCEVSQEKLDDCKANEWEPTSTNEIEFSVVNNIANKGYLDVRDDKFRDYLESHGINPEQFISDLIDKRVLVRSSEHIVELLSDETLITTILPSGETFSSQRLDMLSLWHEKQLKK